MLGGGPDVVYPRANAALHERIAATGLLMSELPPGQRPFRWSFPARNRIMAGLCEATVVVEAAEESGSLITTEFAEDLGRIVGARCPGPRCGRGRVGATRCCVREQRSSPAPRTCSTSCTESAAGRSPTQDERGGAPAVGGEPTGEGPAAVVLAAIEAGEGVDGASAASGLPANEVRAMLARLEDSGQLRRDVLGIYVRPRS